jgi:hypothetical protein
MRRSEAVDGETMDVRTTLVSILGLIRTHNVEKEAISVETTSEIIRLKIECVSTGEGEKFSFLTPTPPLSTCLRGKQGVVLQLDAILRGKLVVTDPLERSTHMEMGGRI